jgi:hypothetical protein
MMKHFAVLFVFAGLIGTQLGPSIPPPPEEKKKPPVTTELGPSIPPPPCPEDQKGC